MWVAKRHSDGALGLISVEQADGEHVERVVERLRIGRHRELVGVGSDAQVNRLYTDVAGRSRSSTGFSAWSHAAV